MYKQSPLPGFPDGAQKVGTWLSILDKDGSVAYFLGGDNYFSHSKGDTKSEGFPIAR
jgi:GTP cyclohydrolase III